MQEIKNTLAQKGNKPSEKLNEAELKENQPSQKVTALKLRVEKPTEKLHSTKELPIHATWPLLVETLGFHVQ